MAMPKPTSLSEPDVSETTLSKPTASRPTASRPSLVPPSVSELPEDIAMRFESALAAHARTEAALMDLGRTVKFLSASIVSIRDAHQKLGTELGSLLGRLANDDPTQSLKRRIQHLEQVVDETSRGAAREREFLVADHDAFILALMADHERELIGLRERLSQLESHVEPMGDTPRPAQQSIEDVIEDEGSAEEFGCDQQRTEPESETRWASRVSALPDGPEPG